MFLYLLQSRAAWNNPADALSVPNCMRARLVRLRLKYRTTEHPDYATDESLAGRDSGFARAI